MKRKTTFNLFISLLMVSVPVYAAQPSGSAYLDGGNSKTALILAHGRGKDPTWKVVDPLRIAVNEQLKFHTLSLQMPNDDKHWKKYADDFDEAYAVIKKGIRFLREEKAVTTLFLMGHSMGSRMVSAFVSKNPNQLINGLIIVGCRNNGDSPLACDDNMNTITIPVLDIWGGYNEKDVNAAHGREFLLSKNYSQAEIAGANHKLDGYETEFVERVIRWLKIQQ